MDRFHRVKVDVHINNGSYESVSNGNSIRSDVMKDAEHAYEQICIRPDETESVKSVGHKKLNDDASESSELLTRSQISARRFSRSSSGSDTSHLSSEIPCYSSTASTPSLSRRSTNGPPAKSPNPSELHEGKSTTPTEGEKDSKSPINGPSIVEPPPPPPPPPPPDSDDIPASPKFPEITERRDTKDIKSESGSTWSTANKSDVSCEQPQQPQTEVVTAIVSTPTDTEDAKTNQVSHLVNKHMVLPFIPPKFQNAADSDTLLKPSEYLKSICKASIKNSLSKARSVDNLDIQGRVNEEVEDEEERSKSEEEQIFPPGPPPPPLPPPLHAKTTATNSTTGHSSGASTSNHETETAKTPQPLATISIQDLTSVQLRRTNIKMNATKTFSAPPPRSVSMTNVSEPFIIQKTDLIAELKKTKDIPGIKKLKVEMAKVEKTQEQTVISEITKAFSVSAFVDQIPEKDGAGNIIPIWKRQMLARKAAERAKKELEEQIARENEEKRQKAIPPWKRQLLAKKDHEEKKVATVQPTTAIQPTASPIAKADLNPVLKRATSPAIAKFVPQSDDKIDNEEINTSTVSRNHHDSDDDAPIIPWRAQLRKTNSKLNILD